MKLPFIKCSPGGNITLLVNCQVPAKEKPVIARHIMALQPDVEQIGFLEQPHDSRAAVRLHMSGGEFCGNAARCCAWLHHLGRTSGDDSGGETEFLLEVSGVSRLLQASIHEKNVRVEMPVEAGVEKLQQVNGYTIVSLEGITHVIIQEDSPPDLLTSARRILDSLQLLEQEAAGVIYCKPASCGIEITPVVWVRDTETLIAETACASGTVSATLVQAAAGPGGVTELQVLQPSGGIIHTSVKLKNDSFSDAYIEGPVEILCEGKYQYSGV